MRGLTEPLRESFRLFPIDQPADAVAETPALAERPCRGTGQVCQRREASAGKLRQQIDHQLVHHTVEEQPAKQLHLTGVCHLGHIGAALAHAFQFAHQVDERITGRKRERAAVEPQRKTFPVVPEPFHPLPASRRKIPVEGECRDYLYLCHTSFRIKSRKRETHATPDRGSGKPIRNNRITFTNHPNWKSRINSIRSASNHPLNNYWGYIDMALDNFHTKEGQSMRTYLCQKEPGIKLDNKEETIVKETNLYKALTILYPDIYN